MSQPIITSSDIQVKYEQLYHFLMEFLWEFNTVQALADLEIAVFKRFPDKEEMEKCLRELKLSISSTYNELSEDDEFKEAFEDLEEAIENYEEESAGCELYQVEEVIDDSNEVEASEDIEAPKGKRKFEFGEIRHITPEERALQEEAMNTLQNPFEEGEE